MRQEPAHAVYEAAIRLRRTTCGRIPKRCFWPVTAVSGGPLSARSGHTISSLKAGVRSGRGPDGHRRDRGSPRRPIGRSGSDVDFGPPHSTTEEAAVKPVDKTSAIAFERPPEIIRGENACVRCIHARLRGWRGAAAAAAITVPGSHGAQQRRQVWTSSSCFTEYPIRLSMSG